MEKETGSTAVWIVVRLEGRQENVSACACDPAHRRLPSVRLIGIQSRAGSMREYWWWWGGAAVCLQQRSTFTARWELTGEPASETDTLSLVK